MKNISTCNQSKMQLEIQFRINDLRKWTLKSFNFNQTFVCIFEILQRQIGKKISASTKKSKLTSEEN